MSAAFSIDLESYFARIGYSGSRAPTKAILDAITFHHATAIPFENLDVLMGKSIGIEPAAVEQKLVHERRGGYCFEQNHLLLLVLQELGFHVAPLSSRVRWQRPRESTPPRTHLFIRVEIDGESWLTDVGVGGLSLTSAIRLKFDGEQPTSHEPRRIIHENGHYFHQILLDHQWLDVCDFTGEEMPAIDRDLANWWTSTNPNSKFCQALMVALAGRDGSRHTLQNREFTSRHRDGTVEKQEIATPEELLALLAKRFDLHFPAGTRFGSPDSPWPS